MSGVVTFVIHYGYGAIRTTDAGADLSEFQYQQLERIGHSKKMLVIFLGLKPELYTVSFQALCSNSSTNIFCELKEIERISKWVGWLKGCERRGTSPIALVVAKPNPIGGGNLGRWFHVYLHNSHASMINNMRDGYACLTPYIPSITNSLSADPTTNGSC
jgi:hypothetical protein